MSIEVRMPKFGLTMQEGTVQRFFKAVGDQVSEGEPLYEIETEKVLYEVEAPVAGVLALTMAEPEAVIPCGELVAVIAEAGDAIEEVLARYGRAGAAAPAAGVSAKAASPSAGAAPASAGAASAAPAEAGRRPVSPVARKLAAELKVDLDKVTGTGPGGRITREDVEHAASAKTAAPTSAPGEAAKPVATAPRPAAQAAPSQGAIVPFRGMRKVIADRMHQSLQQAAQLTITSEADVTAAVEYRTRVGKEIEFTYTDLMIQAVARALRRHPRVNARLTEAGIALLEEVHVGMAVALDEGLIVPVIRDTDRKTLAEIAVETKVLGEKARKSQLKLEDVSGGTFTVSNLGMYGVDGFTPIINLGETAILGVGRIVEKPAIYRGEIARRSMMVLSLTFDHRLIDGTPAAAFLQTVIANFNYGER
ncbi:MAG: dihydrolipoamide acetyltransferase family protein [Candidatus Binataceae bacterium]|jgi:pyruvate dehydrogenase E2 component (dihydrolipoamide acetyltransferase)